jgi:hypothetical protein
VVFCVQLAGFPSVMRRVNRVAGSHMAMVARGLGFTGLVCMRRVSVMLGGLLVMVGGMGMVFVGVVRSHVSDVSFLGVVRLIPDRPEHRAAANTGLRTLRQYFVAEIG